MANANAALLSEALKHSRGEQVTRCIFFAFGKRR